MIVRIIYEEFDVMYETLIPARAGTKI